VRQNVISTAATSCVWWLPVGLCRDEERELAGATDQWLRDVVSCMRVIQSGWWPSKWYWIATAVGVMAELVWTFRCGDLSTCRWFAVATYTARPPLYFPRYCFCILFLLLAEYPLPFLSFTSFGLRLRQLMVTVAEEVARASPFPFWVQSLVVSFGRHGGNFS